MKIALSIKSLIRFFREFVDSWDFQLGVAFLTFSGLAIALLLLAPFHINDYIIAGSIFGTLTLGLAVSIKSPKKVTEDSTNNNKIG